MKGNSNYRIFYLLIVFFVIMIFIPPLLRIYVPNESMQENNFIENNNVNNKEEFISRNLKCDFSQNFGGQEIKLSVFTSYYDKKTTSIVFKYDVSAIKDISLLSNVVIFTELNELKNVNGVEYTQNDTEETIAIPSNDIISTEAKLQKYSQNIEQQQAYYESLGLICEITK